MNLSTIDAEYISRLLGAIEHKSDDTREKACVKSIIVEFESKPVNGAVRNLVTQLECHLGIFESDTLGYVDIQPGIDSGTKWGKLIEALRKAGTDEFTFQELYRLYIKYITYDSNQIEVSEVCRENFGFILHKAVHGPTY